MKAAANLLPAFLLIAALNKLAVFLPAFVKWNIYLLCTTPDD